MNRRKFLQALAALGANFALSHESLAMAPEPEITRAWEQALAEPQFFYVRDYGTLTTDPTYDALPSSRAEYLGVEIPEDITERSMKFAFERIKSFSHYKGLREYKDKFGPEWHDKYLVYEHDFDLLKVPALLSKIIKP